MLGLSIEVFNNAAKMAIDIISLFAEAGGEVVDVAGNFEIMLERVIGAVIILTSGDGGGGGDANVAIMPGLEETSAAMLVDIERFGHGAACPGCWEAVDKTIFVRIFAEPLPFEVIRIIIGVEDTAVFKID